MSGLNETQNELATPRRALWRRPVFWIAVSAAVLLAIVIVCLLLRARGGESLPVDADSTASFEEISSLPSLDESSEAESETQSAANPSSQTAAVSSAPASRPPAPVTTSSQPPAVSSSVPERPAFPIPDTAPLVDSPVEVAGDVSVWESKDVAKLITYADGWIYYCSDDSMFCRVREDGSDQQTICRGSSYGPKVVTENAVYFIHWESLGGGNYRYGIDRIDLRDFSKTYFPATEGVNRISVSGGRIVYRCNAGSFDSGALYAMRMDGSGCQKLTDRCDEFVHEGTRVFFTEREDSSRRMLYCNLESGAIQLLQLSEENPVPRLLKDGCLYFTMQYPTGIVFNRHECPNTCLYRLKLEDFSMTKIVEHEGVNGIYDVQLWDGWLYYQREIGPNYYFPVYTLYRCRPDGGENTYLCSCGLMQQYLIEGNQLYYFTYEDNYMVLRQFALDGSRYETLHRCNREKNHILGFFLLQNRPFLVRCIRQQMA